MDRHPSDTDLIPVKWHRPGRRFHGVVHLVSAHLVDPAPTADAPGRVKVWWPNRARGKEWEGHRVDIPGKLRVALRRTALWDM